MTPDIFGDYFEQVRSQPSEKLSKFCGGCDALKIITERHIENLSTRLSFIHQ